MRSNKNSFGFTMIEILVVIVILGILSVMGVMTVRGVISRAEKVHYKEQESYITIAGKEYFSDYRSKLPKTVGPISEVTLKTLIDENYIKPVLDYQKNACDYNNSKVRVQKQGEEDYAYSTYLKCDQFNSTDQGNAPSIKFTPNSKKTNQDIVVTMGISDDNQVKYYSYLIYKDGEIITNVSKRSYNEVVKIRLSAEGRYKIVGTAWDNENTVTIKESGQYLIDKTPPNCSAIQIRSSYVKEKWTYNSIDLNFKFPSDVITWDWYTNTDGGRYYKHSENKPSVTTKTISDNGRRKGQIILYDEAGNSCKRTTDSYYIDKTVPTVRLNGTMASGRPTNRNVNLIATPTPTRAPSGYTYTFEVKEGNTWKQVKVGQGNTLNVSDEGTRTYQVKVKTGAGKEASSNTHVVFIDKTPPQIPIISNSSNGRWTNKDVRVTGMSNDSGSGISYWEYKNSPSGSWNRYTNSARPSYKVPTFTGDYVRTNLYLRVCDKAGNCSTESMTPIQIDKIAPTKPRINNPTYGDWTRNYFSVTGISSDSGSGISYWQYHTDTNKTWSKYANSSKNTFKTPQFTNEQNENVYLRACDQAGNCSSQTETAIRIDRSAPKKPTITNPTNGNWTHEDFSLVGHSSDSRSGISYWQYRYKSTDWVTYEGSAQNDFKTTPYSKERAEETYLRACDKVGNCSDATTTMIKIDKQAPTVKFTLPNGAKLSSNKSKGRGSNLGNETFNGSIYVKIECVDNDKGSGIKSLTGDKTQTVPEPSQNKKLKSTCTDNAGNQTTDSRTVSVQTYGQSSACGKSYPCGCKSQCNGGYVKSSDELTYGALSDCSTLNDKEVSARGKKYRLRGCNGGGAHQCVCHTDVWDSCASTTETCTATCYPECWHL